MVQITRKAARYLVRVREERGLGAHAGARFVRTPSGLGLTFTPGPEPLDRMVGDGAVPIYLDQQLAAALERSIIDVRSEDGQPRLVIRPQVGAN